MTPVPTLRCRCGHTGVAFGFVTINGKTTCVTCAGSKREKPTANVVRNNKTHRRKYEVTV